MPRVWTIGYQGFNIDEWVQRLQAEGIDLVADVREMPRSRRPGFSKNALATRLAAEHIDYVSIRALGAPPELRVPLKAGTLPFRDFAPRFRALLAERTDDLAELLRHVRSRRVVLVCWEEDPSVCHRSLVAEALVKLAAEQGEELQVVDLRRFEEQESG